MFDIVMSLVSLLVIAGAIAVIGVRFPEPMRPWLWVALVEYMICSGAQLIYSRIIVHGGDMLIYTESGERFADLLDRNFGFVAPELTRLLIHQPSAFDQIVYGGGGSNTGSMHAIAGWMIWICRGSDIGAHVLVSGLALLGTIGIYCAFRDACPEVPPQRMFIATVIFPSVAFWTCAFHKECFGIIGIGLLLTGWRGIYRGKWLRAFVCLPLGVEITFLFRAPALAPIFIGLVLFFVTERARKSAGAEGLVFGPLYFVAGLFLLLIGMLAISRLDPTLGVDKLGENMATRQQNWALTPGGSTFGGDDAPQTFAGQVLRVPLALVNSLFRPQLFDVHNFGALLGALEMTTITVIFIRALRRQGFGGTLTRIQSSPFLLMCGIVTFVGCAFVGLVTFNFGSLSRYRVPFMPFYGAMLTGLIDLPQRVRKKAEDPRAAAISRARTTRRPTIPAREL